MTIGGSEMKSVLTIAGLDPSGGAGILADVKTIKDLGFFPSSAVTVITYQNTCGVYGIYEVEPECIERQISAVLEDLNLASVKVGLVCSKNQAKVIAKLIKGLGIPKVVDPVIKATVGYEFSGKDVYSIIAEACDIITPNADEASKLSEMEVKDVKSAEEAARVIADRFGCSVVVTGGKLCGKDVAFDVNTGKTFVIEDKIVDAEIHGTGCVYSSALACYVAKGLNLYDACKKAREFVYKAVINSAEVGKCLKVVNV